MSDRTYYCKVERGTIRSGTHFGNGLVTTLLFIIVMETAATIASAQSLNWEGQTGVFVTPLAYAVPSNEKGVSLPVVSYHYLDAGPVLGGFHQASITMGALNGLEFGYSRDIHEQGSTTGLSKLWSSGFNAFHGKFNFLAERRSWRPALAVGFVVRSQVQNVGGVLSSKQTTNEDFYLVATKTVTQVRHLALVFNFGCKATNASLLGLAGNSTAYKGRFFGAAAFALKGPGASTILLGSEVLQEPRRVQGLPGAVIPTTITYAIRIVPAGALPLHSWRVESPKLTIDLGVAQVAGNIMPGANLQARHQFALGVSYEF